jgi:hypothetical protein
MLTLTVVNSWNGRKDWAVHSVCLSGSSDIHAQIHATYPCGQNIRHYGPVMESYSNVYVSWDWIHCSYSLSGKAGKMLFVIYSWLENPPKKEPCTNLMISNPLLAIALTNAHCSIQFSTFLFYFNSTCLIADHHQAFFTNPQNWGKMLLFFGFESL